MNVAPQPTPSPNTATQPESHDARRWVKILAQYRDASLKRSLFELIVTMAPFLAIWVLAWLVMDISLWLTFALAAFNGAFLVRLFIIQHDCGHNAFFRNRHMNDFLGRILGVFTVTPYAVWRRSHAIHHSGAGNLDRRGIGDIITMTVAEYRAASPRTRLIYKIYRNPIVQFAVVPAYIFLLQNRLPIGFMTNGWPAWISAMGTNLSLFIGLSIAIYFSGWAMLYAIFIPTVMVAATLGVWLFYVQHQFEETTWDHEENWQLHDAALHGSSHYILPPVLRWFSGNIGIHHVHHLYSKIPFYRLPEVLRDHQELAEAQQLTLWESFSAARLHLWDEKSRKLLSFKSMDAEFGPV